MNKEEFITSLKEIGLTLTDRQLEQLDIYCNFLLEKNRVVNLTAIKDEEGVYLKHFYDSLLIFKEYDFNNVKNLLDIGTGAGFPGMVIKIVKPEINVTLLDSNNKKIEFLKELVEKIGVDNITLIHNRAEEYITKNRECFDVVIARAVSNLNTLSELCIPFVKKDGYFIALKANAEEEIDESLDAISILGAKIETKFIEILPKENSNRTIIMIKKLKETPSEYPRRYDKILKNPLKKRIK